MKISTSELEHLREEVKNCHRIIESLKQPKQESATVLPDGSAFAVMSYSLPEDHWLYTERQYNDGADEPVELGKPILTHEMDNAVVSALRYAIRGASNCGKEIDFDPDALVQNAVYALCGPYITPQQRTWIGLTDDDKVLIKHDANFNQFMTAGEYADRVQELTEARLKDKNNV